MQECLEIIGSQNDAVVRLEVARPEGTKTRSVELEKSKFLKAGGFGISERSLFGDIISLLGAMFWAAIVFLARLTKLSKCSSEMLLLYQLAVSAVILLAVAPGFGPVIVSSSRLEPPG